MGNSPLATYTRLTRNKTSPREHEIDTITIHCYVGQVTAKQGCDYFATTDRECSSNYVIGKDGSIGLSVEEKDRSWCSGGSDSKGNPIRVNGISGRDNDHRAITIEVASDTTEPFTITNKAYKALVDLCTDICKRNNIKKLLWKADKSLVGEISKQNMTVHRWFAYKSCPGDYIYNRLGDIAKEVNNRLNPEKPKVLYRVQVGAFSNLSNAKNFEKQVKAKGFQTYLVKVDKYYKVQVGAFSKKSNADNYAKEVKKAGFDCFITTQSGTAVK